jgi:hypothetical protein
MVAVPVLFLLISLSPGVGLTRSGPVEGHVTFHGSPLAGGSILFVPEDAGQGAWALAWIDDDGHYEIGSFWARDASNSKTRYRICLIPKTQNAARQAHHGAVSTTAWSGLGEVAFPMPDASSGFPAKVCDPQTTQFQVMLGTEPAQVDITF